MATVHQTKMGTYHPNPKEGWAWAVHDSRGYIDTGPYCSECGACECEPCESHEEQHCGDCHRDGECVGLSFAYVLLDAGDVLCEGCAAGEVEIVPCDC